MDAGLSTDRGGTPTEHMLSKNRSLLVLTTILPEFPIQYRGPLPAFLTINQLANSAQDGFSQYLSSQSAAGSFRYTEVPGEPACKEFWSCCSF